MEVRDKIRFNISTGLHTGTAIIAEIDQEIDQEKNKEEHLLYRLEGVQIDDDCEDKNIDIHRGSNGELWVNDFELAKIL